MRAFRWRGASEVGVLNEGGGYDGSSWRRKLIDPTHFFFLWQDVVVIQDTDGLCHNLVLFFGRRQGRHATEDEVVGVSQTNVPMWYSWSKIMTHALFTWLLLHAVRDAVASIVRDGILERGGLDVLFAHHL